MAKYYDKKTYTWHGDKCAKCPHVEHDIMCEESILVTGDGTTDRPKGASYKMPGPNGPWVYTGGGT